MSQIASQSFVVSQNSPFYGFQNNLKPQQAVAQSPFPAQSANNAQLSPKDQLATRLGIWQGLKSGLLFGAIASVPIYWLEKATKTDNLLQQLMTTIKMAWPHSDATTWSRQLNRNPAVAFLASMTGTLFIGLTGGAALGAWITSHTRKRFVEIQQAKAEQQQGTFIPKSPTFLQRLGIKDKPVQNPEQDLQEMRTHEFDEKKAFKKGATAVLLLKVVPTALVVLASLLILRSMPVNQASVLREQLRLWIKMSIHPVVMAKLLALPVMGGFIAKSLAPWMRQQVGLDSTSLPQ